MTAIDPNTEDPVRAFRDALPPRAKQQLHNTARLVVLVAKAIREHGWTVDQLVGECTRDTAAVANVGDRIMQRLERCADNDPPRPDNGRQRVHNGCCDNGFIYDESGVDVVITRCLGSRG